MDDTFSVPPLEPEAPLPTEREANDTAFYAASASKGDPIADFHSARIDLQTTGQSNFVDSVKSQWANEQDAGTSQAVEDIMGDNTVHPDIKKNVLMSYGQLKNNISTSLKDRYIQKTAASDDHADTIQQSKMQDWVSANMDRRKAQMDYEQRQYDIANNYTELQSYLGGAEHLFEGVKNTVGLSSDEEYAKAHEQYKELAEANPISAGLGHATGLLAVGASALLSGGPLASIFGASALAGSVQGASKYAELSQTNGMDQETRLNAALADGGMTAAQFALPIFKATGYLKAMALNGGAGIALGELNTNIQNSILEAFPELHGKQFDFKNMTVQGALGAAIGLIFGKAPKVKQWNPYIPPGSPASTTATANPGAAQALGGLVVKNPSSGLAPAMGTDVGSIVNDWSLPQALPTSVAKMNPDLADKIEEIDASMRDEFQDFRYDPNVLNATKREEDIGKLYQVMRETKGAYYQQSNSVINATNNVLQGKMIFGPNGTDKFLDFNDAHAAASDLANSIKNYPEEERGTLNIVGTGTADDGTKLGPFHLEWNYKKEYDDASMHTFGPDSIQTSVLGADLSNFARTKLANWFIPTGRFGAGVEQGAMRGIERTARLEDSFIKIVQKNIAGTKFGPELNSLITDAEELGRDFIPRTEFGSRFPHLTERQSDKLFEEHTYWRRMQHYTHNFLNRQVRNDLVEANMQGIYDDTGAYLGPGTTKVTPSDYKDIQTIWDFDKQQAVKYDPQDIKSKGLEVVRLREPVDEPGAKHEFGLVGGKIKLAILPNEVLPRIPGYSPRRVKENFFVDMHPNSLKVNGINVTDKDKLRRDYSTTHAAAGTERDASKLAAELQKNNPGHTVRVRPDRQDTYGDVLTDYQVRGEMLRAAQKRGKRLPSVNGPARIEDRMISLINTVQTLARNEAGQAWDSNFQKAYVRGFGSFLRDGQFPTNKNDIISKGNMSREENASFQTAHRLFEYHAKLKTFETMGDFLWKKSLWNIADILEKYKIPAGAVRDLGGKGNLLVKYPKVAATMAFIHMNPVRQWLIQPAQLMEMYAINPHTAIPMFQEMLAVRMALAGDATLMAPHAKTIRAMVRNGSRMHPNEFDETVEAIQKSGLLQSIDMNVLVHGLFKEVDRNLLESTPEAYAKSLKSIITATPRAARAVGFDLAELTNRVGLYLQAKELWKSQNPGKDWRTKENKEVIAAEGLRLSGVMNKAGNLPYQEGALSVLFQFAAINQKLTNTLLQDNATIMTAGQRARLAAVRLALYGAKWGLPGGAAIYALIDKSENKDIQDNADVLRQGIIDRTTNGLIASIVDPDTPTDLAIAKSLTPYSEGFLPVLDVLHETWKMFDDKPAGPRYPAISLASSFGKAVNQAQGWFMAGEINKENFKQAVGEVAEITSGWSNYSQGLTMLGIKGKVTANGNDLGMQYSAMEAYAKMVGFQSNKEIDTYEMLNLINDKKQGIRDMAKDIHQNLMNIRSKIGTEDFDKNGERLHSFMSMIDSKHFNEADKREMMDQIAILDRKSYTTLRQSIFADMWKYNSDQLTPQMSQAKAIMRRSKDPEVQSFIKQLDEGKL